MMYKSTVQLKLPIFIFHNNTSHIYFNCTFAHSSLFFLFLFMLYKSTVQLKLSIFIFHNNTSHRLLICISPFVHYKNILFSTLLVHIESAMFSPSFLFSLLHYNKFRFLCSYLAFKDFSAYKQIICFFQYQLYLLLCHIYFQPPTL
jgi:hypothetical protein